MITIKMNEDDALEVLMERLEFWIKDHTEESKYIDRKLYESMYEMYLESGVFESVVFDPAQIVDNDYINYCHILEPGEDYYEEINKLYEENGIGDISCERVGYNFIESALDYDGKRYFLMRY